MKKIYTGLIFVCMLMMLTACGKRKTTKGLEEDTIELATELRAKTDDADSRATEDNSDAYDTPEPDSDDGNLPDTGEILPDDPDPTEVPEGQDSDGYYYLSKDGSVAVCDYNEISYHKQATEADEAELNAKLDETLKAVSKSENREVTELTDALVAKYFDYKTVSELKEAYRKMIEESKQEKAETAYKNEILSYIVANSSFKGDLTEKSCTFYASLYSYYNSQAVSKNMSFDEYVRATYDMSEDDFKLKLAKDATELACRTEVLLTIAESEKLEISDDVYNEKMKEYMDEYGYTDKELFEKEYSTDVIKSNILQELAFEYVLEKAKAI